MKNPIRSLLTIQAAIILFVLVLLLITGQSYGQSIARLAPTNTEPESGNLRSHEDNFVMGHWNFDNSLDKHLDVQYSLKYLMGKPAKNQEGENWELSFTFTGEFDFYVFSRDSQPVIGRRYNPGFLYEQYSGQKDGLMSWTVSIEHESNGQPDNPELDIETTAQSIQSQYQGQYSHVPFGYFQEMATDSLSRSTEAFAAIGTKHRFNLPGGDANCEQAFTCFEFYSKFRESFLTVEDDIPSDLDYNHGLLEHQGTQLALVTNFEQNQALSLIYRTGELFGGSPGRRNTFDISYMRKVTIPFFGRELTLPVVIAYHHGYLEELSFYSKKSSFFSFGLNFSQAAFEVSDSN